MPLGADDLESVWMELAEAIDRVPAERRELFLCKLALALAQAHDDPKPVRAALEVAARSLKPPR